MIILAAFCRRSLAYLLSVLLIASGLQFIAISSAPVAYAGPALSWVKSTIASQVLGKGVYGQALATSADGSKVFVGATNRAFLSTDYGVTWTTIAGLANKNVENYQVGVAMSVDGTKMYYAWKNEIMYSWDSGQTWTHTAFGPNNGGPRIWSMDASDDGTKILITNRDSNRYSYSINSGQTWTNVSDTGGWAGAISGDGNKIIIADRNGTPRIGQLGGTLTAINLGTLDWKTKDFRGAACDFTCTNILLANTGGGLFTSSDSGATWKLGTNSADSSFRNLQFEGADINSDGTRMAATVSWDVRQDVYISTDFGNTWRAQNVGLTMPQDVAIASTTNAVYALAGGDQNGVHPVSFARSTFPSASTSVLSASNYSPTYGQAVTLTATVQQSGATATNATGTVDFKNNGTSIASCSAKTVTTGIAQCSFTPESASTFSNITAVYSGGDSLSGSSAAAISITVSKANQATLTMANQSLWAHQNAYPTTWIPTAPGSGTGGLVFNYISGPCTISGGVLSGNPTGPSGPKVCTYTVTRQADTNYNATTSAEFTVTMAFSFSRIGLTLPSGATTATYGTPVQITATSFGQIPGKITFRAGGQIISGCSDQSVTAAPWTTTCDWTPAQSGSISLTSDWVPLDTNTYDSKTNWHPYASSTALIADTTPVTISVSKNATTISIALDTPTSIYGSVNTITATTSVPGSVTFKTNHFDPIAYCTDVATTLTPPYTARCDWFPITVATRPLSADLTPQDTAAYASSASNSVMTTSGKAQITITPTAGQSKRYGESNQAITYSITSGALVGSDTLSGALTYTGTNVGSYAIAEGTLTHSKYSITLAPEVFEITPATQSAVSLSSLSSTFNPSNKTVLLSGIGGSSSGTYSYSLDPSNATDGTDGCSVTGSTLTYTSVGICKVTVTRSSDSNFLNQSNVESVSIGVASQTITFGSLSAKEYSGDTFTVSATSSASLPVVFTSVSQLVCTTSGSYGSTIKLLGVGTCVINANQIGDGNTAAASQVSQSFDVNPRSITVTADAKSKNYGTNDPTLTYSITTGSLVLGDSLTGMLTRAAGSDVGTYEIQQSSLTNESNPKYAITFVDADLTITRSPITITPTAGQSKRYGESNQAITYSITSGALVGSDTLSGALTYTGTNAGSYAITLGTLTNTNNPKYSITLAPEVFEITPATQSAVSLSSLSSTFNPSTKTVLLSGIGGSSSGTYSYSLDPSNATDGTDGCSVTGSTLTYTSVGICKVTVTRSSDSNFLNQSNVESVSIGVASQTITFGSLSAKEYSGDTFTVSATSSASLPVVFTSVSQLVCTTSGSYGSTIKLLGVGTCVINANQIGDGNTAAASQVSQSFDVNPRSITVTADAKSKNYGTNDPTLTYSITTGSLVLGDSLTGMLTRAAGSDVGTYEIQQSSLTTVNNPKYAINFVDADLTIDRATPALVLTYPNSNVSILRPGATATPAVATSSSLGALTYATTSASSICTVDSATGLVSLFGAGNCAVAMSTAQTTNFTAHTQITTLTVALLSTSLVGIDPNDLISMGQPFYSHPVINQSYSFSSGSNGASVSIPSGTLDSSVPISVSLLTDSAEQRALIGGTGTAVLSVVVSWVASDGSVPNTNTGKAISVTLTNPKIKAGAKIYSIIGDRSELLGTAVVDGSVTTLITEDPVLLVINPVTLADTKKDDANAVSAAKKIIPQLTMYSVSSSLRLTAHDKASLKKYVAKLKPGATVTCIGYVYGVNVPYTNASRLAKKQAGNVCNLMKSYKRSLKTKVVIYDAKKAPRAAKGAKWVTVSFRIDGTTK